MHEHNDIGLIVYADYLARTMWIYVDNLRVASYI